MKEIERKFFIKTMPDISELVPWHSERFFLKAKMVLRKEFLKFKIGFSMTRN